jgi:hypothetical protein
MDKFDFNNPGPLGMEIETGPEMFTRIARQMGWKEEDREQHLRDDDVTIFNSKKFYPYYFDQKYRRDAPPPTLMPFITGRPPG